MGIIVVLLVVELHFLLAYCGLYRNHSTSFNKNHRQAYCMVYIIFGLATSLILQEGQGIPVLFPYLDLESL